MPNRAIDTGGGMDERRNDDERSEQDPLLEGADAPEETPTEDVVPEDVGSEKRPKTGSDPEPPLP